MYYILPLVEIDKTTCKTPTCISSTTPLELGLDETWIKQRGLFGSAQSSFLPAVQLKRILELLHPQV